MRIYMLPPCLSRKNTVITFLKEFPGISKKFVQELLEHGILHTKHYFELSINTEDRKNIASITTASMDEINKLTKLSNLVRINGVGPVFAVMLFDDNVNPGVFDKFL